MIITGSERSGPAIKRPESRTGECTHTQILQIYRDDLPRAKPEIPRARACGTFVCVPMRPRPSLLGGEFQTDDSRQITPCVRTASTGGRGEGEKTAPKTFRLWTRKPFGRGLRLPVNVRRARKNNPYFNYFFGSLLLWNCWTRFKPCVMELRWKSFRWKKIPKIN